MREGYYATKFERFMAYLIDMFIIYIIGLFLYPIAYRIFDFDLGILERLLDKMIFVYENNTSYDPELFLSLYSEMIKYFYMKTLIDDLVYFLMISVFLVGFAVILRGSTIGQKCMKIKLVKKNGDKANVGNYIARTLVFFVFFIALPGINIIMFIVNIVMICSSNVSLIDRMSNTRLVSLYEVEHNEATNIDPKDYDGINYEDIHFKKDESHYEDHDINNGYNNKDNDDDDDDKYKII